MYLDFFNLNEFPFNVTPDPRFLYFSTRHQEAFDSLLYGINQRKGFLLLTGEVGCGKTTLCRSVLNHLPGTVHSALLLNPMLTAAQLIRAVLIDLGLEPKGSDKLAHIAQLNRFLLQCLERDENAVLIIDEAQNLSPQLMEQMRLLSNLETDQHKLLQIILSGQPELMQRVQEPKLRQLRQRMMIHCDLPPLSPGELKNYIEYRLELAGAPAPHQVLEFSALHEIHRHTQGIPRQVNTLCDRSLLAAYARRNPAVCLADVQTAAAELSGLLAPQKPTHPPGTPGQDVQTQPGRTQ